MKAIKDYEGLYSVTVDGDVYSHISNKFLKPNIGKNGYGLVTLCDKEKRCSHYIHRLVATAYIDKPSDDLVVNHKDGDKLNNRVSNLEWVTYSENLDHAYYTSLRSTSRKYSDEFVSKVYHYLLDGWRQKDVADCMGITAGVVKSLLQNPAYEDLRDQFNLSNIPSRKNTITPEKVLMIAKDLESGLAQNKIAIKYNVAKSLVSNIKTRKLYSTITSDFNF